MSPFSFFIKEWRIRLIQCSQKLQDAVNANIKLQDDGKADFEPLAGFQIAEQLTNLIEPHEAATLDSPQGWLWEQIGYLFRVCGKFYEARAIYESLYIQLLKYQEKTKQRIHKGMPLIWISDCHLFLGHPLHAERYFMLTLCEDALREKGIIKPGISGVPPRGVQYYGMSPFEIECYMKRVWELASPNLDKEFYPERILGDLGPDWIRASPAPSEAGLFYTNRDYLRSLIAQFGKSGGEALEYIALYLMSLIPGTRVHRRKKTNQSDHDVVGSFEGPALDFRSDLGRYFVCECKDWATKADFTTVAKLVRVLDSVKSRFGVLFSRNGITGGRKSKGIEQGKALNAEREQLKAFATYGIAVVVVTLADLHEIVKGANFLNMLRTRYEDVRLDLT